MTLTRRPARLTAWIAIFAVLLGALAPGLARALSSSPKALPWSELCTVAGIQQGSRDAAPAGESGQPRHPESMGFTHCPFCLNHVGHFALPASAVDCPRAADNGVRFFQPPSAQLTPRIIRVAAQPRAPPANS